MALRFAMPGLAAVLLVLLCCCVSVQSQSYIPQPPAFSSCPPGQQLLTLGTTDISNSTLFPYNDEGSYLSANDYYYQYVYITPVTLRGQNAFGVTIYQMALNLLDNRAILEGPAHLRLGIFLYQEAEKTTNMFDLAALIAQTDEITLYPSADQILYANLTQPVILDSEGDYGLAIYTDSTLAVAAGDYNTGAYGLGQFAETEQQNNINYNSYNAYSIPTGVLAYPNDARRPVSATGCLDSSQFKQPNQTYYAFCSLVETYLRQPANNTSPLITSLTNVTRYSGVIAVWNNYTVQTDYGTGYRISFMEGEVQVSTNAGALVYPPLGLHATPFFYRPTSSLFPNASDLLYPDMAIPIDRSGIVITTMRNQTNLFYTGVSNDSTIGQRGEGGVIKTFFSSFDIFEGVDSLEKVITACNVPPGYDYYPTNFQCPSDAAPVSFGDIDLNDVDPVQEDTYDDKLPPNLISFRFFIAWTPNTTIYQLSYFTYANPVAIVHMRMGLFSTNTSYVDSFSALPQYQLLEQTEEIELVNVDDTMIVANLRTPVKLTQNRTYAIGVWADSLLYGPQAQWGVDAAGAPLPYNTIDQDGSFPKQILALGGQTGTQPMAAVGCVAQERLIAFQWCATFADYFEVFGQWYLDRRFYSGTFWGLSREYTNDWGTYHILTAGNGTFWEIVTPVDPPPPPQQDAWTQRSLNNTKEQQAKQTKLARLGAGRNATAIWNLNNFQVQSQDYFYTSSSNGQYFDMNGIQIIMNVEVENYEEIYAVILNSVKPRGSPEFFYQENVEFTYQDAYAPIFNSGVEMHVNLGNNAAVPTCPLINVPWDLVYIGLVEYSYPFIAVCNGLAQMESTYGDNRIAEYSDNYEGHTVKGGVVYTYNFTASAGNYIDQVSLDVLNNTAVNADYWVTAYMGIYAQNGSLLSSAIPIQMLQPLDQMMVSDLDPPFFITEDGLYYVAVFLDHDYFVAQGKGTGLSMSWSGEGGLPATFQPDGISRTPPIAAYGCITASHYFCGSFQYYQGDDYSPVAVDYLYQGLLLTGPNNGTNANGNWVGVLDAVGHLTSYVRIARYAANFLTDWTDILLSNPGNATSNYLYTSSKTGQPLDSVGLTFYTSDEYGYEFTIYWNDTSKVWVDTSNPQLGPELLQTFTLQPIDFTVGIPQCSYLDLEQSVSPASALQPSSQCGSDTNGAVMWGDANSDDYFYTEEGFTAGYYTNITLSPFNTGNTYSNVTQLALTLGQNGNVFAHIRMALYLNATLLAESNELTVDNSQDVTLYFTLNQTVTLFPAATYYIAMWTDVSLYMAQAWDYSGLCYYGITYGYDLQPWPASIGSVEAKYVNCHAIPVAALGCAVPTGPAWVPPVDPNCPVVNTTTPTCDCGSSSTGSVMPSSTSMPSMTSTPSVSSNSMPSLSSSSSSGSVVPNNCTGQGDATTDSGHSTMTLIVAALVSAAAAALVTLLAVWMYTSGKCGGAASKNAAPKRRSGESSTQILSRGDSLSDNYSSLTE